ncbi:MAG: plasmid stabilization system [Massilia sp.]|nr:plasmid stabilization system [Massilia sp.]
MNYRVRYTRAARDDLKRLFARLVDLDPRAARRARDKIASGTDILKQFPFSCRKAAADMPLLRELLVSFGSSGYVMLFEIDNASTVTILAVRHQREDDYY